ncbi:MAG: glycosyltransferase [Alsobacter sp.]
MIDDNEVGVVIADQFRDDLALAGFANANCAFFFSIPETFFDDTEHVVSVFWDGVALPNSPRPFVLTRPQVQTSAPPDNLVANSDLNLWPHGLSVEVSQRLTELAKGWFLDFKHGTSPRLLARAGTWEAGGSSQFAMHVRVKERSKDGYVRLVIALDPAAKGQTKLALSMAVRVPAGQGGLRIGEVFLGELSERDIRKVLGVKKGLAPLTILRMRDHVIDVSSASWSEGATPCLCLDLAGEGEISLSQVSLCSPARPVLSSLEAVPQGRFEDPAIAGQLSSLKLPDAWTKPGIAVPGLAHRGAQRALSSRAAPGGIPFVQIAIPVFNAASDVLDCLGSIARHTMSPHEVILCDDASGSYTGGMLENVVRQDPRLRLIRQKENVGYTANINYVLQTCVADFVVLLNSDTIVTARWLEKMLHVLLSDEKVAAVGPLSNAASWQSVPRTKAADGDWSTNPLPKGVSVDDMGGLVEELSAHGRPDFPLLNGFCTLFRRTALEAAGFFDEGAFPTGYGEENDLCLRLRSSGYVLRVADDTFVFHSKSKSFGHAQRKENSRRANGVLRQKHPTVDFAALEAEMRDCEPMRVLRQRLSERLSNLSGLRPESNLGPATGAIASVMPGVQDAGPVLNDGAEQFVSGAGPVAQAAPFTGGEEGSAAMHAAGSGVDLAAGPQQDAGAAPAQSTRAPARQRRTDRRSVAKIA